MGSFDQGSLQVLALFNSCLLLPEAGVLQLLAYQRWISQAELQGEEEAFPAKQVCGEQPVFTPKGP